MSAVWRSSCRTDVGRVRRVNEDAFVEKPGLGLWLVADGMGGHDSGDVASRMIAESFENVVGDMTVAQFAYDVRLRMYNTNREILELARRQGGRTMGSTVVIFMARGREGIIQWAGDSRAYLMRNGALTRLTRDHSAVEEMIESGRLRREDAETHPSANVITRAVGATDELLLDERPHTAEVNDRILMCSDGLNKEISDDEIASILAGYDCVEASRRLIDTTLERGARDNVTVAIVEYVESVEPTIILGRNW